MSAPPDDRHVVLVTGPPCSGKSTWIERHAAAGDEVLDLDVFARAAGSPRQHDHARHHWQAGQRRYDAAFERVASPMFLARAWVIRSCPEHDERQAIARRLRADRVVVVLPPPAVLFERAARREQPAATRAHIERWLRRYTPAAGDELIRG